MLDQRRVFETLKDNGVTFFTGVPDSYLNGFCNYALANCGNRNVIAANEGNAIGIAAGHFFASREVPLVYMQNSGMGNTVNPLASLADRDVYAVPMLLLIGWRGQGNTEPNHPQHKTQGEITPGLLSLMHIPYSILEDDDEKFAQMIVQAVRYCRETRQPYGLIAPKGVMAVSEKANDIDGTYPMSREEAIETIFNLLKDNGNTVYLKPDKNLIYHYIDLGEQAFFIKPLISESPLQIIDDVPTPTIEKILVDIHKDKDFFYLQGTESNYIFENAFNLFCINETKLLRYASRRGIREEINSQINLLKL